GLHDKSATHRTLAGAPDADLGADWLQAATVLPRGDPEEHLLDDATIQRVGTRERLKRRQGDFGTGGTHPRPANLHLPSPEDDLAGDRRDATRRARAGARTAARRSPFDPLRASSVGLSDRTRRRAPSARRAYRRGDRR